MGYTLKDQQAAERAKGRLKKWMIWGSGILIVVLALGALGYMRTFHRYPPKELMQDIKAGVAARDIKNPDKRFEKYLEGRYGSMEDSANRQKAFLSFFDPEHVRALQFLATHAPKEQQQANIAASARWVEQYRSNLTPAERVDLRAHLNSEAGRQLFQQAAAQYNSQDVYYRGATAPVISELLATLHEVQNRNR